LRGVVGEAEKNERSRKEKLRFERVTEEQDVYGKRKMRPKGDAVEQMTAYQEKNHFIRLRVERGKGIYYEGGREKKNDS